MSMPNDPQLVQPTEAEKSSKGKRPWWVTLVVIWFGLFGLVGGFGGLSQLAQIAHVNWASAAQQAGMTAGFFKSITILYMIFTFVLCISMLVACPGMLDMKKWGALICIIISALFVLTQLISLFRMKTLELPSLIFIVIFALTGVGEASLWRKGRLT
jgi:hypothetical protein